MGTRSFPGIKRLGRGVDHPPPSSAKFKERVELYLYSTSGPLWPVIGWTLPYYFLVLRTKTYPHSPLHGFHQPHSFQSASFS